MVGVGSGGHQIDAHTVPAIRSIRTPTLRIRWRTPSEVDRVRARLASLGDIEAFGSAMGVDRAAFGDEGRHAFLLVL